MAYIRDLSAARVQSKQRYDRLRQAGTCTRCAARSIVAGKTLCDRCLSKQRGYAKRRQLGVFPGPAQPWRALPRPLPLAPPTPISAKVYLPEKGSMAKSFFGSVVSPWGRG